ncbi:Gfo/Idh/MocA family protein [Tessaracoccus oleiagri]|nr:Gfo/Idh/MocA family oxidoreductase [Tessaracoccus oleiagri]
MSKDGMNYAPDPIPNPVVEPGDFPFAVTGLHHGHIFGMVNGLLGAGATLKSVYDDDPEMVAAFKTMFPDVHVASSEEELLADEEIKLVAAADIPNLRADLGIRVMEAGKDYFTDKTPMTTLDQLARAREAVERTGQKFNVYYSERLHVEASVMAGQLVRDGAIGRVIQVLNLGPHRLNADSRPDWFFDKEQYGGILADIGSHNCEQILYFTGAKDAEITDAAIANYNHPQFPELDDFGNATLVCDNGATGYFRVDWFTPDGLSVWGDGRSFLLGTEGYIELRKYVNVTTDDGPDNVFMVNGDGEHRFNANGKVGYPFFGEMVLDCLNRTEEAMTQEHIFKSVELALKAQERARVLTAQS